MSAIAVALFCLLVWFVIRELGKPPPPPRIEPGATPALQAPGVGQ
jgi:hypothetical protein